MRFVLVLALAACQAKSAAPDADLRAAIVTTDAYFHALAAKDWTGVCSTRTDADREKIAKLGGTCEEATERMAANLPMDLFTGVTAANARRKGEGIEVDVMQPGAKEPAVRVFLMQEGGRWLIAETAADAARHTAPAQPAATTETVEPLAADHPDVLAAVTTIDAYFKAFVARDHEAMCATRTAEAKQKLAASAGSCVRMMEVFTRDQAVDAYRETKAINPRRRGAILAFDLQMPGKTFGPVYLMREGGQWLMFERDAADKF